MPLYSKSVKFAVKRKLRREISSRKASIYSKGVRGESSLLEEVVMPLGEFEEKTLYSK